MTKKLTLILKIMILSIKNILKGFRKLFKIKLIQMKAQ